MGITLLAVVAVACTGASEPAELPEGVTEDSVKVGMWWIDAGGTCSELGVGATGEQSCGSADEREYQALVDYINENGGLGGRTIEPVIFHTTLGVSPFSLQAEQACTHFTEDDPVYAVISEGQVGRSFLAQCLADRGVLVIEPSSFPYDDQLYEELSPHLYQPQRARPERWVAAYIDGLKDQGFFDGDVRIGLIRFDGDAYSRVTESVLKPRLESHGLDLAAEAAIRLPAGLAQYGDLQAEMTNAIIRFKDADVNRVIFFTNIGEVEFFVFGIAEEQRFRPRYAFSSSTWTSLWERTAPTRQLQGAVGVGWLPFFDVDALRDPGGSEQAALCESLLRDADVEAGAGRNSKCDSLMFLDAAIDGATETGDLTPAGVQKAVESLGTSFEPAATFATQFGPGRYDGPAAWRPFAFQEDCECFQYTGEEQPLP